MHITRLFTRIALAVAIAILLPSCKKDTITQPPTTTGFSAKITVKNPGGTPAAGLRISAWNHLSIGFAEPTNRMIQQQPFVLQSSTIRFDVATRSKITLSVFEFDGAPVTTLVDGTVNDSAHAVYWQIQEQKPTRIYKYRFVAQDSMSGALLFRDSLYAVLWQPDPDVSILGWTSQGGTFETSDKLLFPNVLDLPALIQTYQTGPDPIGTFTIRDTVTIVLTDTAAHRQMMFLKVVNKGVANDIQLVWNPTLSKPWLPGSKVSHRPQAITTTRHKTHAPINWKLYQNYPNPFN